MSLPGGVVTGFMLVLASAWQLQAQDPRLGAGAPRDRPVGASTTEQRQQFEVALAPHIARARETFPEARGRFLAGLPAHYTFFVTVPLSDAAGRREMVFLVVDSLARDSVYGRIWNQIHLVQGYHLRDAYATAEAELLDWMISRPDRTEEGNFVGKFLDTYRP
jgi:hypothetical protein